MEKFTIYVILLLAITIILIWKSILLLLKTPSKEKQKHNINALVEKKDITIEDSLMDELLNGQIKCHVLKNNSPIYDPNIWKTEMQNFLSKPITQELLLLEGKNFNEKY